MKYTLALSLMMACTKAFQPMVASPRRVSLATFATKAPNSSSSSSTSSSSSSSGRLFIKEELSSSPKLQKYNSQITNELTASQLYLSASLWCEQRELSGMAKYFRAESDEERGHALLFVDFANRRRIPIELQALQPPPRDWADAQALWECLLEAERQNTESLKELADFADDDGDRSMTAFLDPFHMEQVESEDHLMKIIAKIRDQKETPGLLRQLDTELEQSIPDEKIKPEAL
jgi:ferritin